MSVGNPAVKQSQRRLYAGKRGRRGETMQQKNESDAKSVAFDWVNENRRALSDWNQVIWHYAEPALREYKSAAWYVDRLSREGSKVEAGSGGMPTAFSASFENGPGGKEGGPV